MYIINENEPFRGFCQSIIVKDKKTGREVVAYSDGLTFEEYKAKKASEGISLKVIGASEFDKLNADYMEGLKTSPQEVSEARFWEMLEVLPPERWENYGGFESFHVSEHLTADLVTWLFHTGGKYYECTQSEFITRNRMIALVAALAK